MICAVIVTYNRKNLLGKNIEILLNQTKKLDCIIIVDNCSTDGTFDYLSEKGWINSPRFKYIKTKSNIGGAGGFYTGIKYAYENKFNWIVLMDDDGRMANEYTLENLYTSANYLYNQGIGEKKLFVNALVQEGDLLSFKMGNKYTVEEALAVAKNDLIENEANPFNGTMISRELVEAIGLPNKDFFIKGDEVDYKQRTFDVNGFVVTVTNARYIHPRPETYEKIVLGKKVPFFVEAPWKEYYAARNFTYMYKRKGWIKAIAFELIFVKILAILTMKCKKIDTLKMLFKGVKDGWNSELGAVIKP